MSMKFLRELTFTLLELETSVVDIGPDLLLEHLCKSELLDGSASVVGRVECDVRRRRLFGERLFDGDEAL